MKKVTVTFEITEAKTEVIIVGSEGNTKRTDITGSKVEKRFTALLRSLNRDQLSEEVESATNLDTWQET